jgi:hypothetical protein
MAMPMETFTLETLDAPLITTGQRRLLRFDNEQPDMKKGIHVNLFNNLWGTRFHSGMSRTCGSALLFMLNTRLAQDY